MASYDPRPARPGVLNLIAVVSLLWSVLGVIWFLFVLFAGLGVSILSWLGGPVAGAVGTTVGLAIVLIAGLKSLLSLLLFVAGVKTWGGDPAGRSLHTTWAWIIVVVDALDLLLTGGMDPSAWWGLIYAGLVLYFMNQPDVVQYFEGRGLHGGMGKPPGLDLDRS